MNIADSGSAMYPSLFEIKRRGFKLQIHSTTGEITAERDGNTFHAESASALLGLITMAESRGENWLKWSDEERADHKCGTLYDVIKTGVLK